jgi:hypothetical protein
MSKVSNYWNVFHQWLVWWDTPKAQRHSYRDIDTDIDDLPNGATADQLSGEDQQRLRRFCEIMLPGLVGRDCKISQNAYREVTSVTLMDDGVRVEVEYEHKNQVLKQRVDILSIISGKVVDRYDLFEIEKQHILNHMDLKLYLQHCHDWLIYWGTPPNIRLQMQPNKADRIPDFKASVKLADFPPADRRHLRYFYKRVLPALQGHLFEGGFTITDAAVVSDNGAQVEFKLAQGNDVAPPVTFDPLSILCGMVPMQAGIHGLLRSINYNSSINKHVYAMLVHKWLQHWAAKGMHNAPSLKIDAELAEAIMENPVVVMDGEQIWDEEKSRYTDAVRIHRPRRVNHTKLAPEDAALAKQFWDSMRDILPGAMTTTVAFGGLACQFVIVGVEEVDPDLTRATLLIDSTEQSASMDVMVVIDVDLLEVASGGVIETDRLRHRAEDFQLFGRGNPNNTPVLQVKSNYGCIPYLRNMLGPGIPDLYDWDEYTMTNWLKDKPHQLRAFAKQITKRYGPVLGPLVDFTETYRGLVPSEAAGNDWPGRQIYRSPQLLEKIAHGYKRSLFRRAQKFDKTVAELPGPVENAIFAFADLASEERKTQEADRERHALKQGGWKIVEQEGGAKIYATSQLGKRNNPRRSAEPAAVRQKKTGVAEEVL